MRIEKCYFCSCNVYPGHGSSVCRNDGRLFIFCRSKCAKAFKNKKNPRKTRWTKTYRLLKNKDIAAIAGRRVNEPGVLTRDLLENTVEQIPKILEISGHNSATYIKDRILTDMERMKADELLYIERNIDMSSKALETSRNLKENVRNIVMKRETEKN